MPLPQAFRDFNLENAIVSVWLYKKSADPGGAPKFTGRWIETNEELDAALRAAIADERGRITEVNEYSLLAENNEGSALRIDAVETHANLIAEQAAAEIGPKKATRLKQVQNTDFYSVKFTSGDSVLYAVRKTDASWQSKKARDAISVFFADEQLGLNVSPGFNISRYVDFFVLNNDVIISNKANFESVLSYKQAHAEDFEALQVEPGFAGLFTDLNALVDFVGSNKLHLRRACAIRQKGHYQNAAFVNNLRQHHARCGLNLVFDPQGLIVPSPETCADIIRAFLDHRLLSVFSENVYDVPDATIVH